MSIGQTCQPNHLPTPAPPAGSHQPPFLPVFRQTRSHLSLPTEQFALTGEITKWSLSRRDRALRPAPVHLTAEIITGSAQELSSCEAQERADAAQPWRKPKCPSSTVLLRCLLLSERHYLPACDAAPRMHQALVGRTAAVHENLVQSAAQLGASCAPDPSSHLHS
jgi:hypothetical protein